jgi:fructose-specific PTS system IIA-like component
LGSELEHKSIPFDHSIPLGAMIEIPATAFLIEHLSREVDYFSIGTNDLAQYVMAACRNNDRLLNLYDTRQPPFLRLLAHITSETRRLGKWIGMCGEMAGNRRQLPLLVGLGLDEISMIPARIPEIKTGLRRLHSGPCKALLEKVLRCGETAEVEALLQQFTVQGAELEIVQPQLILLNSPSRCAEEAIKEMVNLLTFNERVENGNEVEDLIWQREEKSSTAIGTGVAVPHCQSPAVGAASVVLLRPQTAIPWPDPQSAPVDLVILLALPAGEGAKKHLRLIAGLSRRLMHDEFRQRLLSAADEEQVSALLRECL